MSIISRDTKNRTVLSGKKRARRARFLNVHQSYICSAIFAGSFMQQSFTILLEPQGHVSLPIASASLLPQHRPYIFPDPQEHGAASVCIFATSSSFVIVFDIKSNCNCDLISIHCSSFARYFASRSRHTEFMQ